MPTWSTSKTVTRITINGQTYSSVEEMPPDIRRQYEEVMSKLADTNNNGIPDVLEGAAGIAGGEQQAKTIVRAEIATRRFGTRLNGQMETPIVQLTWPTLLALLATAAVVAGGVVWMVLTHK